MGNTTRSAFLEHLRWMQRHSSQIEEHRSRASYLNEMKNILTELKREPMADALGRCEVIFRQQHSFKELKEEIAWIKHAIEALLMEELPRHMEICAYESALHCAQHAKHIGSDKVLDAFKTLVLAMFTKKNAEHSQDLPHVQIGFQAAFLSSTLVDKTRKIDEEIYGDIVEAVEKETQETVNILLDAPKKTPQDQDRFMSQAVDALAILAGTACLDGRLEQEYVSTELQYLGEVQKTLFSESTVTCKEQLEYSKADYEYIVKRVKKRVAKCNLKDKNAEAHLKIRDCAKKHVGTMERLAKEYGCDPKEVEKHSTYIDELFAE